jgi:ABC-type ATPase involved in cell division
MQQNQVGIKKKVSKPMIRFENVGKVFSNGYIGLQDVSFSVEPGTLSYLVGESGAGKTTLMRLLIRDITPSEGEIYIDEEPLSALKNFRIINYCQSEPF